MAKLKKLLDEAREALAEQDLPLGTIHKWKDGNDYVKTRQGWVEAPKNAKAGAKAPEPSPHAPAVAHLPGPRPALPAATSATANSLPDAPERYFHMDASTKIVPLSALKTIRARPSGIEHAATHMANAYNGTGAKRKPVSVSDNGDGTYTVLDGNSTTNVAMHHKWKGLPVNVIAPATTKKSSPLVKRPEEFESVLAPLRDMIASGKLKKDVSLDEHVDIAEKFLGKHQAALPKSLKEIESLCVPGSKVKGRTKTLESALGKLVRKPKYGTADKLQDGTGLRVICDSIDSVKENVKRLKAKYKIVAEDDYISTDKDGYRSHHLVIEDADGLQKEVQVRTPNQNAWADWCHETVYKPTSKEGAEALERHRDTISKYASEMSEYFYARDLGKQTGSQPPCPPPVKQHFGCL
jgi:ppGpp synthetase/RelA/SpoT-type nucleotidyltranferase